MKFSLPSVVAALTSTVMMMTTTKTTVVDAFSVVPVHHQGQQLKSTTLPTSNTQLYSMITEDSSSPPCAIPTGVDSNTADVVTASVLRSAMVTNANGELVSLGDQMGTTPGTSSIVVFLRHLG